MRLISPRADLGVHVAVRTRQAMYVQTLTLRRVQVTAAVERQYHIFYVCACGLSYPACKATALCYIVICGLSRSIIFFQMIS
jgi:hypothetical protein